MNIDFNTIINRRDSDSEKWNKYDEDVLPLWVADTDFMAPAPIINAIRDRLDHGLFGYSFTQESSKIAVCDWLERRHDWKVTPEEIIIFPGVVPAFNIATRACTNPGDSVLIQTPAYHPFLELPQNTNLTCSNHSINRDGKGHYLILRSDFMDHVLPKTRIFMLCNPQNPTGRVFTREELTIMAEACLEHNIIICSDEIHSDIIYPPNHHIPFASLSEEIAQATITLLSPSKTFNLAGLKSSVVIIQNPHLRESFINQTKGYGRTVNILGEAALTAAYSQCDDWLDEFLDYLDTNRKYLHDFVHSELPGVRMNLPEGTYLGWLDFSGTSLDSPAAYLLDKGKVALNSGDWFGNQFAQFARINFGCQNEILSAALDRIKSALISL